VTHCISLKQSFVCICNYSWFKFDTGLFCLSHSPTALCTIMVKAIIHTTFASRRIDVWLIKLIIWTLRSLKDTWHKISNTRFSIHFNKGNNKITELRAMKYNEKCNSPPTYLCTNLEHRGYRNEKSVISEDCRKLPTIV
jgi:hypothetical protein